MDFIDCFRHFYPDKEGAYTWWSNRLNKRLTNQGWRLDYFFISKELISSMEMIKHDTDTLGSDHCPILLQLNTHTPVFEETDKELAEMWRNVDWEEMENKLLKRQKELTKEAYKRNFLTVKRLQSELVKSEEARLLAIRHISIKKRSGN